MRPQLQYIADTILIESMLKDDDIKIAIAQESSIGSTLIGGLKSYVFSIFDKNRPISSIASLLTSSLLWALPSKKLAILYTLAGALGFDWKGFWNALGGSITTFVKEILSSGKKADGTQTASRVNEAVSNAISSSFTGNIDKAKITEMAQQGELKSDAQKTDDFSLLVSGIRNDPKLIKIAGVKSKLAGTLIKVVGWVIVSILGILGLTELGKAFTSKDSDKTNTDSQQQSQETQSQGTGKLIKISPNAPQELFSIHRNNMSSVWIEHGDISEIEDTLKSWIFSAYPQLEQYESQLLHSSSFQSMLAKFEERNKLASGLGFYSIPRPYQRKIDVVSMIVGGFVRSTGISPSEQPENKIQSRDGVIKA